MSSPMALVTNRFFRAFAVSAGAGALAALVAGCATTGLRTGQTAEKNQDYDRAVIEYTKVLKEDPDNRDARLALDRAKLRAALDHYNRGLRFRNGGRLDEALVELQIASELNPASGDIDKALTDVRSQLRTKVAVTREGKTQLETLIERSRDLPPVGLDLPPDAQVPAVLTFSNASARDVFTALGRFARVNVVFDPTFRDQTVTIDMRNSTLEAALQAVAASTRNFYRVTAQRTITVVPDTPAKRREYEEEVVRTFFLSNADVKETMDLLRIVVDLRARGAHRRHQRDHHQGHARARGRGRQADRGASTRRGPKSSSTSSCSRSIAPGCASSACRSPRPATLPRASTARSSINRDGPHAARPAEPHAERTSS